MSVFDATPLIYLAKTGTLDPIVRATGDCYIPEQVYEEVVETGIRDGHADARRIQRAAEEGLFDRDSVSDEEMFSRLCENTKLSAADAAVLTITKELNGIAVMDERYGRAVANAEGIPTRGTAYLVIKAISEETMTAEEARSTIDAMVDAGWFVSPSVYTKIVGRIDDLR